MLAVRDEVDELKERIVELQSENEAMKEILTVDQRSRLQLSLNRSFVSNCFHIVALLALISSRFVQYNSREKVVFSC